MKNLELLSQPLDHTRIDFDEENKNSYEKYDVTIMTQKKRSTINTGLSLHNGSDVNLDSIQGVNVDENVGKSTSSSSRTTEPATTHLPKAGGDLGLFQLGEHTRPNAASTLAAAPSTPPASISKASMAVYNTLPLRRLLFQLEVQKLQ